MDQQRLNFIDDEPCSHQVDLDKERRQALLEVMGTIVIQVFNSQKELTDEPIQEGRQN